MILWLAELVLGFKVDPKLEPQRILLEASRHLCVHDALASGHPLEVAWPNHTRIPLEVLMVHLPRQHISDSLKTAMWMVREARRKLDIEEVEHQEWVKVVQKATAYDSSNFRSVAFSLLSWLKGYIDSLEFVNLCRRALLDHLNQLLIKRLRVALLRI